MLNRRPLLALPALLLARPALAAGPALFHDVSEVRVAVAGTDGAAIATRMAVRLGVPVVAAPLQGMALAQALNAGHVEAALLDPATLDQAAALMGPRLMVVGLMVVGLMTDAAVAVRTVLPEPLRTALTEGLRRAA